MNEQTTIEATEPTNMTSEEDVRAGMIESLRATAMLADVTIGTWSGERSDMQAMDNLKASAGATGKVGRVIKYLMAGADARLKDTRGAFAAIRTAHISLTQPWVMDINADRLRGPRLLPNILFEQYLNTVGERKRVANDALDTMLAHYDEDVALAKTNLGGLADDAYPSKDQIRGMFYVKIDFEPLPASADFRNLPPHFASKLAENLRKKQETMMQGAQASMWQVIRERVGHARARLADEDLNFKASTIDHLRAVVDLAPAWNIAADDRVPGICAAIADALHNVTPKDLRKDAMLRAKTAEALGKVLDTLDGWGV